MATSQCRSSQGGGDSPGGGDKGDRRDWEEQEVRSLTSEPLSQSLSSRPNAW